MKLLDDAGVGPALGHQLEHLEFPRGEPLQRVVVPADQQLRDDLRVQGGAAAGQSILARQHLSTTLGQPGVTRAVIGYALYLAVAGLLGLALGTVARSTAGGISALFGVLFALPLVAGFLPGSLADEVSKYLPGTAGQAITTVHPDPATSLSPWTGFGVFCAYAAVLLTLAALRMRRGDAHPHPRGVS